MSSRTTGTDVDAAEGLRLVALALVAGLLLGAVLALSQPEVPPRGPQRHAGGPSAADVSALHEEARAILEDP